MAHTISIYICYVIGRIKGMQLDYTGAYTYLQEAIRRAPSNCATGFRVTV
jgi:hypothetical protein